jgi:hypothetical protein
MKKTVIISFLLILVVSFSFIVKAEEDNLPSEPGISADSPIYFLKRAAENTHYSLAGEEKKIELNFLYAQRRLLEAKEIWKKGNKEKAKELLKEGVDRFSIGVEMAANRTVESYDWKAAKQEVEVTIQKIRKLMAEQFQETIEGLF